MKMIITILGLNFFISHFTISAQEVLSINPFYDENLAYKDNTLNGIWTFMNDTIIISAAGDNFYHLNLKNQSGVSKFEVATFKINFDQNNKTFLNIYPKKKPVNTPFEDSHIFKSNSLWQIKEEDSLLTIYPLNFSWFQNAINGDSLDLEFGFTEKGILLTSFSDSLIAFIKKNANRENLFGSAIELKLFKRATVAIDKKIHTTGKSVRSVINPSANKLVNITDCEPVFPNKDGWIGGDGAVSVALSDNQILWFFSDTFVGERDLQIRNGSKMVSNTIALTECGSQEDWDIKYFWRNMYTDNPKAFFETKTDRYRYWIQNVFLYKENIYAALHKVRPLYSDNTNDIGTTMARISDFRNVQPDKWQIEYIPWSTVFQTNDWLAMANKDDYLYMFTQPGESLPFLTRIHMDYIENPASYIQYWSKDLKWKLGKDRDDALPILTDKITGAGGSLCYHEDLQKWLLIYGPGWYGKDIWIHTASRITGPWSERKVIYEVPESTPGNPKFNKKNFCYFAREHCEFFDDENQKVLITYDNSLDSFGELINSLDHYFPRVVYVPINFSNEVND